MVQPSRAFTVLFLCAGNSARSILAEAILNRMGRGRFIACSAGCDPVGRVHPAALRLLGMYGYDFGAARPKTWLDFSGANGPRLDMVFTLCDRTRGEVCPHWQGEPVVAHWELTDPAEAPMPDQMAAFHETYLELERRIRLLTALPLTALDRLALKARLRDIGGGEVIRDMPAAAGPA